MTVELVKNTDPRKGSNVIYNVKGLRGNIYFPASLFAKDGPDTLSVEVADGTFVTSQTQRAGIGKMTPEERKAAQQKAAEARKNETPAQKAERARVAAEKAAARAAKLAAVAAAAAPAA